jgi:hypothetical protein
VANGKAAEVYSPFRAGALSRKHVMTRYRIADRSAALPRSTGLAVLTAGQAGRRYYAVTVAVGGREAVTALEVGKNATGAVDEQVARFPNPVYQQSVVPRQAGWPQVDVYAVWLEPPLVAETGPVEISFPRWPDTPRGTPSRPVPLWMYLGGGGVRAPAAFAPRRHVRVAVTVAVAPRGGPMYGQWMGDHECLGTLRGYDQGVVVNHGERLALALTAWALDTPELSLDRERVSSWGAWAGFALRHGDVFAVAMSNGHNTYKTSKGIIKAQFSRWGTDGRGKNCFGVEHLDYLDLAKWVRENPNIELPYWVCFEEQGYFPDHTLGDFGFKPWQEFLGAMKETRRAFAAEWNGNGPRETRGVLAEMVPRLRLHQTLPAFTNCSLDASPQTDQPKGKTSFKADQDYLLHADKQGGINLYQRWGTDDIVDEADRWALTVWLAKDAPSDQATTDLTPRRCQKFRVGPGERVKWTITAHGKAIQSGEAVADRWGLVTLSKLSLGKGRQRVTIERP